MFNLKAISLAIAFSAAAINVLPAHAAPIDVDVIAPHSSLYYTYTADQSEIFEALLSGDGDTDLDLVITNRRNDTVCESASFDDDEYCQIRSRNGGTYTIEVQNLGAYSNRFVIAVN